MLDNSILAVKSTEKAEVMGISPDRQRPRISPQPYKRFAIGFHEILENLIVKML